VPTNTIAATVIIENSCFIAIDLFKFILFLVKGLKI